MVLLIFNNSYKIIFWIVGSVKGNKRKVNKEGNWKFGGNWEMGGIKLDGKLLNCNLI